MTYDHNITINENANSTNVKKCGNGRIFWTRYCAHILMFCYKIFINIFGLILLLENLATEEDLVRQVFDYAPAYATNWNVLFQTTFLFLAVSYDTLQWIDKENTKFGRRLKYFRDVIFCGLMVPITLFVTGMFWTVYWIDRELVFPKVYDKIVPWWFNHCVHTVILVVVLVETLLQPRRRPRDERLETRLLIGATVLYAVVYYSIYFFSHRWLYGVFGIMTWWQVCFFQTFIWGISYVFYRIQFPINRLIHGQNNEEDNENSKRINVTPDVKNGTDNSHYQNDNIEIVNDNIESPKVNIESHNDKSHCKNDNLEISDSSQFKIDNVEVIVSDVENGFDKGCSYVVRDNSKFR